jgi:hypothetical protein
MHSSANLVEGLFQSEACLGRATMSSLLVVMWCCAHQRRLCRLAVVDYSGIVTLVLTCKGVILSGTKQVGFGHVLEGKSIRRAYPGEVVPNCSLGAGGFIARIDKTLLLAESRA